MPINFPTQGEPYKIVPGDYLIKIAGIAYGDSTKWALIWEANKNNLRSGNPNLIYPDEIINIPKETIEREQAQDITGKEKGQMSVFLNGIDLPIIAGRITKTMDMAADGWTATIPWEPDKNPLLDIAIQPRSYPTAKAYLGNSLAVTGLSYITKSKIDSSGGSSVDLEGFSYTADIVDSTMLQPYEANNVTLLERAKKLCEPKGIQVISEITTDGVFDRVTAKPEDKIFEHLANLARQRSALISNTKDGKLLITSAKTTGQPVATIEEQVPIGEVFEFEFNGREIFNTYVALGQSPRSAKKVGKAVDVNVPKSRQMTFSADESTPGNIDQVAEFQRNKQYIASFTKGFPVSTWYSDEINGVLWDVNTLINVKSKTMFIPNGFTFLIRQVDFIFEDGGTSAVLYLVPPQVYSNQPVVLPWGQI
jgi:prophage tail gpP-like protein